MSPTSINASGSLLSRPLSVPSMPLNAVLRRVPRLTRFGGLVCCRSARAFHPGTANMARDYKAAVSALNTLQTNFAIVDAIRKSGKSLNKDAIPEMVEWLARAGYEPRDLNVLNPIHIAGTKGKGSTSAFVSSILAQYAGSSPAAPKKIGLYTSPHLQSVRERIQINNSPLSEEKFAHYFFELWDRLEASEAKLGPTQPAGASKPVYFRYLTLMAFHAYIREGVDTAIFECGIGGEYDSTNIIESPAVCAVTTLDIDHVALLGDTIDSIAWHKAGIFKSSAHCKTALTIASQQPSALAVLRSRAEEKGLSLVAVENHQAIESGSSPLSLAADFQKTNASLAVAVASLHLRTLGVTDVPDLASSSTTPLPDKFSQGLACTTWGGRCETRQEGPISWHIDGGHTLESIKLAAKWFATCLDTSKPQRRILFFNQQTRDAPALAKALHAALGEAVGQTAQEQDDQAKDGRKSLFDEAVFTTNITFMDTGYKPDLVSMNTNASDVGALTVQNELAQVWSSVDQGCQVHVRGTIEEGIKIVREAAQGGQEVKVLITGSLHLVGGALEVLESSGVGPSGRP